MDWMRKLRRISDLLDAAYGKQKFSRHNPPLDELVLTILSQNTTAKNCREAFRTLSERFPVWEAVRTGGEREVAAAIYSGGLSEIKSRRIKSILEQIHEAQGNLDLSWLEEAGTEEAREFLLRFEGVGPKTAACVLLFSLGRPVMPVDTHVHRVCRRLGLIGPKVAAEQAHEEIEKLLAPEISGLGPADGTQRVYSLHINMVRHGREVCAAGAPKCSICALREDCDYFARTGAA